MDVESARLFLRVKIRHHSFHEISKKQYRESIVAMFGTINHTFFLIKLFLKGAAFCTSIPNISATSFLEGLIYQIAREKNFDLIV